MTAIFEAFVETEYRRDVETRKELYGDDADAHPLPRTASQRAFDALFAMFVAAYASPEGRRLPDSVVADGGRTDQDNSNVVCGSHNRIKHRQRWRTRRDVRGRAYTIRADGTVVLPVGERVPDLIPDDPIAIVRFHFDQLRRAA